jgi:hypothetical protein
MYKAKFYSTGSSCKTYTWSQLQLLHQISWAWAYQGFNLICNHYYNYNLFWCLGVAHLVYWVIEILVLYLPVEWVHMCLNLSLICLIQFKDLPSVDCHRYPCLHDIIWLYQFYAEGHFKSSHIQETPVSEQRAVNDVLIGWQLNEIVWCLFFGSSMYIEDICCWFFGMQL